MTTHDMTTHDAGGPAATLRALHHGRRASDPLVLPGPWDAASARVFAEAGFPALQRRAMAAVQRIAQELLPPRD